MFQLDLHNIVNWEMEFIWNNDENNRVKWNGSSLKDGVQWNENVGKYFPPSTPTIHGLFCLLIWNVKNKDVCFKTICPWRGSEFRLTINDLMSISVYLSVVYIYLPIAKVKYFSSILTDQQNKCQKVSSSVFHPEFCLRLKTN